jgi:hypothetical protein
VGQAAGHYTPYFWKLPTERDLPCMFESLCPLSNDNRKAGMWSGKGQYPRELGPDCTLLAGRGLGTAMTVRVLSRARCLLLSPQSILL